jgi:hypothetical protein
MKIIRTILLLLVAAAIIKVSVRAASILDEITVAPVAALKTENITGQSTFGAGLDLGYNINKFVSIHAASLAYESDGWRSSTIDETELYGRANFVKFAQEKFVLYGKGGVVRDWNDEAWATSVGLGVDLRVTKNVALGADYSIRAWFSDREKDSLARALISISF